MLRAHGGAAGDVEGTSWCPSDEASWDGCPAQESDPSWGDPDPSWVAARYGYEDGAWGGDHVAQGQYGSRSASATDWDFSFPHAAHVFAESRHRASASSLDEGLWGARRADDAAQTLQCRTHLTQQTDSTDWDRGNESVRPQAPVGAASSRWARYLPRGSSRREEPEGVEDEDPQYCLLLPSKKQRVAPRAGSIKKQPSHPRRFGLHQVRQEAPHQVRQEGLHQVRQEGTACGRFDGRRARPAHNDLHAQSAQSQGVREGKDESMFTTSTGSELWEEEVWDGQ